MRVSMVPGSSPPPPLPADGAAGGIEPYAEPPFQNARSANLSRVISTLRRFRWLIAGLAALGLVGGIVATKLVTPEYEVSARIWIETPNRGKVGTPIQGEELLDSKAWVELLTTFKVLDPVVHARKLFISHAEARDSSVFRDFELGSRFLPGRFELEIDKDGGQYHLRQRAGLYAENGPATDSIGRQIGWKWQPHIRSADRGRKIRFEIVSPREASVSLAKRLGTNLREDNFLLLTLRENDPNVAAVTMNTLISRFVDEAASQK